MRTFLTIALVALSININAFAQNPKKGIKKLDKKEYTEAKTIFDGVLKEEPENILAYYGLALLYSINDYPEKDLFMSIEYILKAKTLFNAATPKVIENLNKFITLDSIEFHTRRIDNSLFAFVKNIDKIEITKQFLQVYPGSTNFKKALSLKEEQDYNIASIANTISSYEEFINKYPYALQVEEANKNIHQLSFMDAVSKNTIEAYQAFITQYPKAKEVKQATEKLENLEFNKANSSKNPLELSKFLNKYPNSNSRKQIEDVLKSVELIPYRKGNLWGYCDKEKNFYIQPQYDTVGFFIHNVAITKKTGDYVLINKIGEAITHNSYDYMDGKFCYGMMRVKKNNLWGFVDTLGQEIVPLKYSAISTFDSGFAKVYVVEEFNEKLNPLGIYYETSETYIVNKQNKNPFFEKYFLEQNIDLQLTIDRKCGVINPKGEIVILPIYFEIFRLGKNWIATKGEKYKEYFRENGTDWVGPPAKENEEYFKIWGNQLNHYSGFTNFDQWFLLSPNGNQISAGYNHFSIFSDGMIAVSNGGEIEFTNDVFSTSSLKNPKWGYIDSTGKELIPLIYQKAEEFLNGKAYVWNGIVWNGTAYVYNREKFIDKKNNVLAILNDGEDAFATKNNWVVFKGMPFNPPVEDSNFSNFNIRKNYSKFLVPTEGLMAVNITTTTALLGDFNCYIGGKWGFIDENGIEVIPLKFDNASPFSEGLAAVNIGKTYYFVHDSTDNSDRVKLKASGKYGYIDKTGKIVIPIKFDAAFPFSEGLAAVNIGMTYDTDDNLKTSGKYGFIDKTGKMVIPPIYQSVEKFSGGYAIVENNDKSGLISKNNEIKIPFEYQQLYLWKQGFYIYNTESPYSGKNGIISISGKIIQPAKYDNLIILKGNTDFGRVEMNGKTGFIRFDGTEFFED
jgi:outer membrane protein assembly factor BamD (BamD/ComL family)